MQATGQLVYNCIVQIVFPRALAARAGIFEAAELYRILAKLIEKLSDPISMYLVVQVVDEGGMGMRLIAAEGNSLPLILENEKRHGGIC